MGRVMALDFGTKRTGIAVSDELKMIASGLTTVPTQKLMAFLKDYFKREKVERVLVGEPKQKDGSASPSEVYIQAFLKDFKQQFPAMPITRVDERFTSKIAFQSMIDSGLRKKQRKNKALIDEVSATLILQTYLYQ